MHTLPELLERRARETPDAHAYRFIDGPTVHVRTWAEMAARARGVAAELVALGAAPGDRALLLFPEGLELLDAFFGCFAAGVLAVPAHAPDPARLARTLPRARGILEDCDPRVLITRADLAPALVELAAGRPVLVPSATDGPALPPPPPDAVAYLQYTSGSTSEPRGVIVTHLNLIRELEAFSVDQGYTEQSVVVSWLPSGHDYGLIYGRLMGLYVGVTTAFLTPDAFLARPRAWLEAFSVHRGTHSPTPNFGLDLTTHRVDDLSGLDLSCVRAILNAAEPIRESSEARFVERFSAAGLRPEAMLHAMGMAESTLMCTRTPIGQRAGFLHLDRDAYGRGRAVETTDPDALRVASTGYPTIDTRALIVDPDTREPLPNGRVGELWLGGSIVARGYWNRPDATAEVFGAHTADGQGPFLRTGDLGFLHEGALFVSGRRKDVIILRGQNHHPQDLEWAIQGAHPDIRPGTAAAFGVQTPEGEGFGLVTEVREDASRPAEVARFHDVLAAIRGALADHGVAATHLALLPRGGVLKTSSGKLRRAAIREAFLDGSLPVLHRWSHASAAPARPAESLRARVIREAGSLTGAPIQTDRPWRELGLDSVAGVELLERVGRAVGRALPASLLYDHPTVDALVAHLEPVTRPPDRDADVAGMTEAEAEAALLAELDDL